VHLDESPDHQWIDDGHVRALLDQVVGQGQVVGAGGLHHVQALHSTPAHELRKAGFRIAHFRVLESRLLGIAHPKVALLTLIPTTFKVTSIL
jgi:hypothetical protein